MQITIELTSPTDNWVNPTGHEVCALIDSVREMIRYNMGPERAYNSCGPVYAADGTTLAMWKLEL